MSNLVCFQQRQSLLQLLRKTDLWPHQALLRDAQVHRGPHARRQVGKIREIERLKNANVFLLARSTTNRMFKFSQEGFDKARSPAYVQTSSLRIAMEGDQMLVPENKLNYKAGSSLRLARDAPTTPGQVVLNV